MSAVSASGYAGDPASKAPSRSASSSGEAEMLARLREQRRERRRGRPLSMARIADILNAEGRATRRGEPRKSGSVFAILRRLAASPPPPSDSGDGFRGGARMVC
jgi:hypothetical protein